MRYGMDGREVAGGTTHEAQNEKNSQETGRR
jgi:hypothetical protein